MNIRVRSLALLVLGVVAVIAVRPRAAQTPKIDVAVQAGRLIDGVSTTVKGHSTVLIAADRIVGVEDGWQAPAGARVIDLQSSTVLPGLIDAHTHITTQYEANALLRTVTMSVDDAVRSTVYAKRTLEAGFTSIRNVGAHGGADVALKRAINDGMVEGPRIWTARTLLSATGGHGDEGEGLRPDLGPPPDWTDGIIDGVDAARRAVRYQQKYGADLIKIAATGGVLSLGDSGDAQELSDEEIRAVVETAHAIGLKVAAHAHGKKGIEASIRAGVDSIEHGTYSDAETFALFKQHGTYLVPTIIAGRTVADRAKVPGFYPPAIQAKALAIGPLIQNMFHRAYQAGVKVAFGTDAGVYDHGENAREFQYMVEAGMPPMEAILASLRGSADLIGVADRIGSLQPCRYADVIAVAGDPIADITQLQHVTFVMKGGVVVKSVAAAGR